MKTLTARTTTFPDHIYQVHFGFKFAFNELNNPIAEWVNNEFWRMDYLWEGVEE